MLRYQDILADCWYSSRQRVLKRSLRGLETPVLHMSDFTAHQIPGLAEMSEMSELSGRDVWCPKPIQGVKAGFIDFCLTFSFENPLCGV